MNKLHVITVALLAAPIANAQSVWAGTVTSSSEKPGSFDYEINTRTDTMTISNKTGFFANTHGPGLTTTLYAMNDFTTPTAQLASSGPTFDVTNAHFNTSTRAGLGIVANDGWYWLSETKGTHFFHMVLGAKSDGPNPLNDWNNSRGQVMSASTSNNASTEASITWSNATIVASPEPSSVALLGLGALGLLARRNRN